MIALDLFAGTGWGVACQRLGIEEFGVEIMPEARATREANGMHTAYADVWDGLIDDLIESRDGYAREAADDMLARGFDPREVYELLIASPPCQTFSMAGGGAGRKALDEVLALIDAGAYLRPAELHAFGEKHDPRTALVLTPLAHVARDTPTYVVWEQVPPVLPVWERAAEEMREWGYSVWTGILNAEQYGVPQTRRRAILIARADGKVAAPPTPTHSRYYSRDPKRLDEGVLPWVSMAEALGWGDGDALRSNQSVAGEGRAMRDADQLAFTMTQTTRSMQHVVAVERHRGAGMLERDGARPARSVEDPAPTVTGNASGTTPGGFRKVMRSNYGTGGDAAARGERGEDTPAPTMTSKADRNMWQSERPSTTVMGDARVMAPGHKVNAEDKAAGREYPGRPDGATRVTVAEAATLQSYPPDFVWCGTKTKQFLQVGNAVPPLLAEAILKAAIS